MAGKRGGFYAVRNGRQEGVYQSWHDCKKQVSGYPGASFKRFDTLQEAQDFTNSQSSSGRSRSSYDSQPSTLYRKSASYGRHAAPSYSGSRSGTSNAGSVRKYYSVKSSNPSIASRIFSNWKECEKYVKGQKGLSFKKFEDESSAQQFMKGEAGDQVDYRLSGITKEQFESKYKLPQTKTKYLETSRVYCDGSALANGTRSSIAGYGVHFADEPGNDVSEPLSSGAQTNNRAEIQAVSSALDIIWHNLTETPDKKYYEIKTDSEYVAKLLNDRYFSYSKDELDKLPNSDLINPLLERFTKVKLYYTVNKEYFAHDGSFTIKWVKGHAGEPGNEKADELAKNGALKR